MLETSFKLIGFVLILFVGMHYLPKIILWATNVNAPSPSGADERVTRSSKVVDKAVEAKLARRAKASAPVQAASQAVASNPAETRDYSKLVDDEMEASTAD